MDHTQNDPEQGSGTSSSDVPFILVVDDEENFARRLAMAFEEAGYEALACFDGASAMTELEKGRADLVVLDVRMPGMDGLQVLRTLHANSNSSAPLVILFTGAVTPKVDAAATLYPGAMVLEKPCSYDTVIARATKLLSR